MPEPTVWAVTDPQGRVVGVGLTEYFAWSDALMCADALATESESLQRLGYRVAPKALVTPEALAVVACAEAMRDNRARQRSDETAEERAALFAEADRLDREMAKLVDAYRAATARDAGGA